MEDGVYYTVKAIPRGGELLPYVGAYEHTESGPFDTWEEMEKFARWAERYSWDIKGYKHYGNGRIACVYKQ